MSKNNRALFIQFFNIYLTNAVFVYLFTYFNGHLQSNFLKFVFESIFYVLPYTLVNYIFVGLGSLYYLNREGSKFKYPTWLALIFLAFIDIVIFSRFFNNSDFLNILLRIVMTVLSYFMTDKILVRISKSEKE